MAYYFMTFYKIGWISSICHLHGWVIFTLRFLLIHNSWKTDFFFFFFFFFFFQSLNHVYFYLKPWFLMKSSYHIVPSPSTALPEMISVCLIHWPELESGFVFYSRGQGWPHELAPSPWIYDSFPPPKSTPWGLGQQHLQIRVGQCKPRK